MADSELVNYLNSTRPDRRKLINMAYKVVHGSKSLKFLLTSHSRRALNLNDKYLPILFDKKDFSTVEEKKIKRSTSLLRRRIKDTNLMQKYNKESLMKAYLERTVDPHQCNESKSQNFNASKNNHSLRSITPIPSKSNRNIPRVRPSLEGSIHPL